MKTLLLDNTGLSKLCKIPCQNIQINPREIFDWLSFNFKKLTIAEANFYERLVLWQIVKLSFKYQIKLINNEYEIKLF